jgi:hypothetical protein
MAVFGDLLEEADEEEVGERRRAVRCDAIDPVRRSAASCRVVPIAYLRCCAVKK